MQVNDAVAKGRSRFTFMRKTYNLNRLDIFLPVLLRWLPHHSSIAFRLGHQKELNKLVSLRERKKYQPEASLDLDDLPTLSVLNGLSLFFLFG